MKNVKFFVASVCVALLAFSCVKNAEEFSPANENAQLTTITCAFPSMADQNGTKVSLATDGTTQWEVGDKIVIYGNPSSSDDTKRVVHEIEAGDIVNPEVAVFSVNLTGLDAQNNSDPSTGTYYPYTVAYPYTDGQPYYLGTGNNNYGRTRFQNTNQLLMAGHVSDDNSAIVLNHLTAAITFKVSGDFDSYTFSGVAGTEVVGYSNLVVEGNRRSLGEGRYRQKYNDSGTSGDLTSITGSVNGNGTAVNHIFLPVNAEKSGAEPPYTYDLSSQRLANVVYLPNGFTIKFFKGGDLKKYITSSKALIIEPGHMINLGLLPDGSMHTYVAPTVHNNTIGVNVATAYDLSSSAAANCYLLDSNTDLAANKAYKFKAAKGKGGDVLANIGGDEDNDVVVLWETVNTDVAPSVGTIISDVDFDQQEGEDAYIVFKMPAVITPGNAVIAAKNTAGDILWSWHIWVPSSDVTSSNYGLTDAGQVWMDRNLGALTVTVASADTDAAPSSFGLFYAWGRKDPFPGLCSHASSSLIATTGSFTMNGAQMSVAASYGAPTTMVATGADAKYSWTTDTPTSSLWGSSKTVNDPCPPGFKVPEFMDGKGLWHGASGTGFAVNSEHHWFKMGTDPYIVFPIVGYIDGNQSTAANVNRSDRVYVWSSTATSTDGLSYNLRANAVGTSSNEWQRQARAGSIRCVAE